MTQQIKKILGKTAQCGFGICRFDENLVIEGVRSANRIPKEAKSIIVCLFPYYVGEYPQRNISLYAMLTDYHKIAGQMLKVSTEALKEAFPENKFSFFVDSSPIKEVLAAVKAGLGKKGLNGLLINEIYGSYCFIGEIVTDLQLYATDFNEVCIGCGACIRACPTGALSKNGIDTSLCRSSITQKKGELNDFEKEEIKKGGFVWGCDICQTACPFSKNPVVTPIQEFKDRVVSNVTFENLDQIFPTSAFAWRKKSTILRNLSLLNED